LIVIASYTQQSADADTGISNLFGDPPGCPAHIGLKFFIGPFALCRVSGMKAPPIVPA
jgi:hypothetical protein